MLNSGPEMLLTTAEMAEADRLTIAGGTAGALLMARKDLPANNLEEFVAKVNSDLVGKVVNLASRTAKFVEKSGLSPAYPDDLGMFHQGGELGGLIADYYEAGDYNAAMREIMVLADRANKFVEEKAPWTLSKDPSKATELQDACTVALNLFRQIVIYLAPVLPELALVLLPFADGFILESDFRAAERYHRLLWQLTDLHPHRRPLLVLQTFEPAHAAHKALQTADLQGFMESELALRRTLGYPPATRMVKLEVAHPKEPVARDAIYRLAEALRPKAEPGELLGPAPAPVARLRGQYVFHLLLKSSEPRLQVLMENLPPLRGARLRLDPDPQSFVGMLED